jgi:carbonic anhydrase
MFSSNIEKSRKRLLLGLRNFQENIYPKRRDDYERLGREGQRPDTLFITCSDSRVDPELLTQSGPGELFVSRNIGNMVPAYGELLGGISALVEYAVAALKVNQIVVCGHTDCGAMKTLLHPEQVDNMPTVKRWLRNGEAALNTVRAHAGGHDETALLHQLIEQNVLLQMNHLRTHPAVAGRLAERALAIFGWVYDIAHGDVRIFDDQEGRFASFDGSAVEAASAGAS